MFCLHQWGRDYRGTMTCSGCGLTMPDPDYQLQMQWGMMREAQRQAEREAQWEAEGEAPQVLAPAPVVVIRMGFLAEDNALLKPNVSYETVLTDRPVVRDLKDTMYVAVVWGDPYLPTPDNFLQFCCRQVGQEEWKLWPLKLNHSNPKTYWGLCLFHAALKCPRHGLNCQHETEFEAGLWNGKRWLIYKHLLVINGRDAASIKAQRQRCGCYRPEANRLDRNYASEYDKAIARFDEAIRLYPMAADGYNNRAWFFATCPDPRYRDGKKAIDSATRACELSGWKDNGMIDTLAAAYAEAGDFDKAVEWQEKAIKLPPLVMGCGERLRLYKAKKPFRNEW